jgi:hypothetical protein
MEEQKVEQKDYSFAVLNDGEWIVETNIYLNEFYAARLVEAVCPMCLKKRYHFEHFFQAETPLPKEYICPQTVVAVTGRIYKSRSGASWTTARWLEDGVEDDPAQHGRLEFFLAKFEDIQYFEEPKHAVLVDLSSLPSSSWIHHWDTTRVVFTEKPVLPDDVVRKVQSLCWDCCEQIIKNASETMIQGNLILAKVNSPELEAVYQKIKNRATDWSTRFFNHEFQKEAAIFRNFCAYDVIYGDSGTLMPDKVLVSADHEPVTLSRGSWVGYHPDPKEAD